MVFVRGPGTASIEVGVLVSVVIIYLRMNIEMVFYLNNYLLCRVRGIVVSVLRQ